MSLQSALSTYEDNIGYLIQYYHDIWQMCKNHNISMTTQGGEDQPISAWADLIANALEEGGSAVLGIKNITVNDTYNASDDGLDGYSQVTVNVPSSASLGTKEIADNGTYNASGDNLDGYSTVKVNLPLGTKNITTNGDYYASAEATPLKGYSRVSVAVLPNVGIKNITANDTYNASDDGLDGYSSVTVNVSGGGANLENDVVFTTNGLKNPSAGYDGFGPVTVQVPTTGGRMMGQLQLPFYSVSTWIAGNSYVVGDIVKWKLNYFYCIEDNHDDVIYFSHWVKIIETPVTAWTAGTAYKIGDIVTYNTTEYYYCIENNQDTEFTPAHWIQMNV